MVRWRYDDPPLVWLFVAAYAMHLLEESFGGFAEWMAIAIGRPLPIRDFVLINAAGFGVMIAAAALSTRCAALGWLAIGIATLMFVNGLAHLFASLATGTYSPGLITGTVLYLPLGQLALLRAWDQAPAALFGRGVLAGLAAQTVVSLVAFAAAYR